MATIRLFSFKAAGVARHGSGPVLGTGARRGTQDRVAAGRSAWLSVGSWPSSAAYWRCDALSRRKWNASSTTSKERAVPHSRPAHVEHRVLKEARNVNGASASTTAQR